jgi:hypothetical protein
VGNYYCRARCLIHFACSFRLDSLANVFLLRHLQRPERRSRAAETPGSEHPEDVAHASCAATWKSPHRRDTIAFPGPPLLSPTPLTERHPSHDNPGSQGQFRYFYHLPDKHNARPKHRQRTAIHHSLASRTRDHCCAFAINFGEKRAQIIVKTKTRKNHLGKVIRLSSQFGSRDME